MEREIQIQEEVFKKLEEYNLYPFSVICSFVILDGILSITFYFSQDLKKFLEIVDYSSQCDKTGYDIFEENNTIVLSKMALYNFYTTIL